MLRSLALASVLAATVACQSSVPAPPQPPTAGSGDASFSVLAAGILEDNFRRHPSAATDLGVHKYDAVMDDASQTAIASEVTVLRGFLTGLTAVDAATLSPSR